AGIEDSSAALERCLAASGPSPSQIALRHEAAVRLADALARLPEDYQTVLLLRVFEELPAEEVARRMGRSAGAVRMLQMRALTALRQEMEQDSRTLSVRRRSILWIAQRAASRTSGSVSSKARRRAGSALVSPMLPNTRAALRSRPRRFVRSRAVPRKRRRNS